MPDSLLVAAAAPLTAFALAKFSDLSSQQRLAKALEQAQKEVAFWRSWYDLQSLLCTEDSLAEIKATAFRELARIQACVSCASVPAPMHSLPRSTIRRILLLYRPATLASWLARVAFYALSVYAPLLLYSMAKTFQNQGAATSVIGLGVLLTVVVVAMWSRALAIRIDLGRRR
jgi:hypothetical protein